MYLPMKIDDRKTATATVWVLKEDQFINYLILFYYYNSLDFV